MTKIEMTTQITAPRQLCFDLSLTINIELEAAIDQQIKAVGGVTSGIMRGGDTVTWKARQFGPGYRTQASSAANDSPGYFQDSMLNGVFKSFAHDHFFASLWPHATEMRDELFFSMPSLMLGKSLRNCSSNVAWKSCSKGAVRS